jgi:protein tyrosine/serine phosphatase
MSKRILISSLLTFLLGSVAQSEEWKLVWSDEFTKDGVPDAKKWTYEVGFIRNREAQYYTKSRKENTRVENGMLIIESRKEKFKNPNYRPDRNRRNWNRGKDLRSKSPSPMRNFTYMRLNGPLKKSISTWMIRNISLMKMKKAARRPGLTIRTIT